MFCYPELIDGQMSKLFSALARQKRFKGSTAVEFATKAAHFVAELNAIHPFREGNGRTQLTFLTLLAETAGHSPDLKRLEPDQIMNAMIESFGRDETLLAQVIYRLIDKK